MRQTERLDRQFAEYELVERIADGRMGEVFQAKSEGVEGFEKILCVKILYPRLVREDTFVDSVIEEAKRSVSLSHANVAQVLDLGQDDESGRYYIASEHISGFDLGTAQKIAARADRQWPRDLALFIASEVAKALDYAHRRKDFNFDNLNLLHRDVTPSNILISYDGEVKVTDFGLSRAFDAVPVSREDNPDRRYLYAPPEHARGADYSRASDIFGLGLVTYEMLTGRHPYRNDGKPMRRSASDADIPPISEVLRVPADLEQIIDAMLEPEPTARIDNAGTVYEELVGFLYEENLRSDSRALSGLMSELRSIHEDQRDSPSEPRDPSLDEISHADVKSFYERSEVEAQEGETGTGQGLPEVPGRLDDSFKSARQGRGRAVLMSGQFGRGREYLPDRLADVLIDQADTRGIVLHRSDDDRLRPWGLIADLLETLANRNADHGIASEVDSSTLSLIDSLGGSEAVTRLLSELWGLRRHAGHESLLSDEQPLDNHLNDMLRRWMRQVDRDDETIVIVIDRVERADRRSLQLLRRILDWIGSHSVLLVMSTKDEKSMRDHFDVGKPDALRAVRVGASEATGHEDIPELDPTSRRVLAALSVLERPVRRASLGTILSLSATELDTAANFLLNHGLARTPHPDSLLSATTDADFDLEISASTRERSQLCDQILEFFDQCRPSSSQSFSRTAPTRLRLHAVAGRRELLEREAAEYEDWLVRFGWEPVAADLHHRLADTLNLFSVGDTRIQFESLARGTHYSLESGALPRARQTLEPLAARTDNSSFAALAGLLRGRIHLFEDDLEEARRTLQRAADLADRFRARSLQPRIMLALARLAARYGDPRQANEYLSRSFHLTELQRNKRFFSSDCRGQHHDRVVKLGRGPHQPITPPWRAQLLEHRVRLQLGSGHHRAAHDTASTLASLVDSYPAPTVRMRSDLTDGLLFEIEERPRMANHRFERVIGRAHNLGLETLLLSGLLHQADLACRHERFEHLRTRADYLLDRARPLGALYFEQRAREYRAMTDVLVEGDKNGLSILQQSLQRAQNRAIPRDIVRCHRLIATVLERASVNIDGELEAEDHRRRARAHSNRWRLEIGTE